MGVTAMRYLMIAAAAAMMFSAAPAGAVSISAVPAAQTFSEVVPAAAKKHMKKKKEKVEYMRAAPM
jgi:ABC-type transporter MlaC component